MDDALSLKADKANTLPTSEIAYRLDLKADKADTYDRTTLTEFLNLKADKAAMIESLYEKADKISTYSKVEVYSTEESDTRFGKLIEQQDMQKYVAMLGETKADKQNTYARIEMD